MQILRCGAVVALALQAWMAGVARADGDATVTARPVQESSSEFYGYQVWLADAAALVAGLAVGAANDGSDWQRTGDVIATTWALGAVGALGVHAAHGNGAVGAAGTGVRLVLPPLGALFGVMGHCLGVGGERPCSAAGGRAGLIAGMITASLIDGFALGREHSRLERGTWYGYKALIIDTAALAVSVGAVASLDSPTRSEVGAAMLITPYLVGFLVSPWVHAFHGRIGTALGSLTLRALGPALGAVAGVGGLCAASGTERRCSNEGAIYGLFAGTLLVAAIDIAVMSYDKAPAERASSTASVTPFVVPMPHGVLAGLGGVL